MTFRPTSDRLMPELTPAQSLVLLARALWREGYDDHIAGHITLSCGDGTLLCNPHYLSWTEFTAADVLRIDLEGRVIEGNWPAPLGIPLHLALHRARPDVHVAMHSHPRFGTIWADMRELPVIYDQSSSLGGGRLVLVDEYPGAVNAVSAADEAIAAMGDGDMALLAGHGVFVTGTTIRAVHQRAVALEQRCRAAWMVRAAGSTAESAVSNAWLDKMARSDGNAYLGFWEAAVRQALRDEPGLLDDA
jgi:L-ribulose-5-phosphate 4-epimerase